MPSDSSAATIAELSVRVARAEIERDEAIKRAETAEKMAWALLKKDKEGMLDTLHIMGIPARDYAELYEVEMSYRRRNEKAES